MSRIDLTRIARRFTLVISGEAMQSGFHFALNLILVHLLSARDFGIFAIVLVIGGLSLTYVRGLSGMPASIWIGRSPNSATANAYDVTFGSGAVLIALGAAIGVDMVLRFWLSSGALAGACFVGLWSMRSYLRTALFARGQRKKVVLADFIFVVSGIMMTPVLWLGGGYVLDKAFTILAMANGLGLVAMLWLRHRPFRVSFGRRVRHRYSSLWRPLGWSGLSVTAANLQGQAVALLVTAFGGPAAYAPIAATVLLFVPLRLGAVALINMLQPEMSAELARGEIRKLWFQMKLWSVINGFVGLIYGALVMLLLPHLNLQVLQGVPIHIIGCLAWAIYMMTVLYVMPRIVLEVMTAFGTIALITAVAAAVGVTLIICLLLVAPPIWALAGGAASELIVLVACWAVAYRKVQSLLKGAELDVAAIAAMARRPASAAQWTIAPTQGAGT